MDKKKFSAMTPEEISQKLELIAEYQEFAGDLADARRTELSESDLELVSAAGTVPPFEAFLAKMKKSGK